MSGSSFMIGFLPQSFFHTPVRLVVASPLIAELSRSGHILLYFWARSGRIIAPCPHSSTFIWAEEKNDH